MVTGDGFIVMEEVATVMRSLGLDPSSEEIRKMLEGGSIVGTTDIANTDIRIDFDQFCAIMVTILARLHCGQKLYEIDAWSTGPFTRPLAHSLAPLTHSLALHCSLRSRAPLRSVVRSLAHTLAIELMGKRFMSMK